MARATGIGDLIVAPIIGDEGPLGAIEVYRRDRHAFDDIDAAVLGGLADQAAIAITNARLIEELERSQAAVARRADTERALRDITARIAALREPEVILDRVVEEARRLLGTDGAHLTRMGEDGTYLVPVVVDRRDRRRDAGLAARHGVPARRRHQRPGRRARRAGLDRTTTPPTRGSRTRATTTRSPVRLRPVRDGGGAAARARRRGHRHAGHLVGDAAQFEPEELDLLQGLADQAAIAITNSTLLTPADRVGGALSLPRRERAGPRLVDRGGRAPHLRLGLGRADDRLPAGAS